MIASMILFWFVTAADNPSTGCRDQAIAEKAEKSRGHTNRSCHRCLGLLHFVIYDRRAVETLCILIALDRIVEFDV